MWGKAFGRLRRIISEWTEVTIENQYMMFGALTVNCRQAYTKCAEIDKKAYANTLR